MHQIRLDKNFPMPGTEILEFIDLTKIEFHDRVMDLTGADLS